MRAALRLELIGDDRRRRLRIRAQAGGSSPPPVGYWQVPSAWVAELTPSGRRFLRGATDYTFSNSAGSRGIFRWYTLESGRVYEVSAPVDWHRADRYLCRVTDDGDIVRLTQEEAVAWRSGARS